MLKDSLLDSSLDIADLRLNEPDQALEPLPFDLVDNLNKEELSAIWAEHANLLLGRSNRSEKYFDYTHTLRLALGTEPMPVDHEMWKDAFDRIDTACRNNSWVSMAEFAFMIKVASPNHFPGLHLGDREFHQVADQIDTQYILDDPGGALKIAVWLKVISPEYFDNPIYNPNFKDYYSRIVGDRHLEGLKKQVLKGEKRQIQYLCQDLASFRLVYPEQFWMVRPDLKLWNIFRDEALRLKNDNTYKLFLPYTAWMRIIAADQVKVTDFGIKITDDPQLENSKPLMPEVRSY